MLRHGLQSKRLTMQTIEHGGSEIQLDDEGHLADYMEGRRAAEASSGGDHAHQTKPTRRPEVRSGLFTSRCSPEPRASETVSNEETSTTGPHVTQPRHISPPGRFYPSSCSVINGTRLGTRADSLGKQPFRVTTRGYFCLPCRQNLARSLLYQHRLHDRVAQGEGGMHAVGT